MVIALDLEMTFLFCFQCSTPHEPLIGSINWFYFFYLE